MAEAKPNRMTGILIRIRDEGYGFIHVPHQGDYYVNASSMKNRADWTEGKVVNFTPGNPRPGKATPAYDVVAASDEDALPKIP